MLKASLFPTAQNDYIIKLRHGIRKIFFDKKKYIYIKHTVDEVCHLVHHKNQGEQSTQQYMEST